MAMRNDIKGWFFFTDDGNSALNFVQKVDFTRITMDTTEDCHNVWWALIKRNISPSLDLS